jgi:hypothetical protein
MIAISVLICGPEVVRGIKLLQGIDICGSSFGTIIEPIYCYLAVWSFSVLIWGSQKCAYLRGQPTSWAVCVAFGVAVWTLAGFKLDGVHIL